MTAARLQGEGGGELCGYAGGFLDLLHDRAFPPGKPLQCLVEADPPMELVGRTVSSKKQTDGRFLVRMRLTNLRKVHRLALEALFAA